MSFITSLTIWLTLVLSTDSAPIRERRQTHSCSSYTIINTRGTGEPPGESISFQTMNTNIQKKKPNGKIYNTIYPATLDQQSSTGTNDIINKIHTTLTTNPSECFILQGYSQGSTATISALPHLTGPAFEAVRAVLLLGDPVHTAGLTCNVDNRGGSTTRDVNGIFVSFAPGIPDGWVGKTRDVCILGDGICDTTNGPGFVNAQHMQYAGDSPTQQLGTEFIIGRL